MWLWYTARFVQILAGGIFFVSCVRNDEGLNCFIMPSLVCFAILTVICG